MLVTLTRRTGTYDSNFLSNYAPININDQLARIAASARSTLFGGSDYAMRIWVAPDQLQTLGLTVADLVERGEGAEHRPAGRPDRRPSRRRRGTSSRTPSAPRAACITPEEFGDVIVRANPDGSIVRLKRRRRASSSARRPTTDGPAQRQVRARSSPSTRCPGSNALDVAKAVRKRRWTSWRSASRRTSSTR